MLTPLKMSRTVSASLVSTIICPLLREPLTLNVPEEVMVALLPSTVALTAGLTVIEFAFSCMLMIVELFQT